MAVRTEGPLTEAQARLLLEPNYAVVATIRPDGTPQQTVVWVDWDGEHAVFNTAEGRAKPHYLRERPYASLLVFDAGDPYRWLAISGRTELAYDGAEDHIHKLARKYQGRDRYALKEGERRVIVRIEPERVRTYNV